MPPSLTVTNIRQLINGTVDTWRPMIEAKGILLTSFIDDNLHDDRVIDSKQFRMCLNTLLSNAAHYTDNGRVHIHVTANNVPKDKSQDLKIIIIDTGIGMSQDEQTEILRSDNGLRLSDAKMSAQNMGGDLEVISNSGRGSEFILTCQGKALESLDIETNTVSDPVEYLNETVDIDIEAEEEPIQITDQVEPQHPLANVSLNNTDPDNLRGLRVLIVDDIPSNHDVIKLFLTPERCECICVDTGEKAIEAMKTQNVDIILMDIRMPGMDGIQATQKIRDDGLDIPIIALTADDSAETNVACMAAGADLFLAKPVLRRDLIESIRFVRRYKDDQEDHINAA